VFQTLMAMPPREIARWCGYAFLLLAPGSFVILPVLWLARHVALKARGVTQAD
jgi:hypothetical protein